MDIPVRYGSIQIVPEVRKVRTRNKRFSVCPTILYIINRWTAEPNINNMVVAKFWTASNEINPCIPSGKTVTMSPVMGTSKENKKFYEMTPGGGISLSTINMAAADQFGKGEEKYVLFLPTDEYDQLNAEVAKGEKSELKPLAIITTIKGSEYSIPRFEVVDGKIIEGPGYLLKFCKGDINDPEVTRQTGFFTETLIAAAKQYLEDVNVGDLASRDTAVAITKLDEALLWIGKRAQDRKDRGVQQPYKK